MGADLGKFDPIRIDTYQPGLPTQVHHRTRKVGKAVEWLLFSDLSGVGWFLAGAFSTVGLLADGLWRIGAGAVLVWLGATMLLRDYARGEK